jgi:tetratricopeptide (TPR) repeat protein
VNVSATVNADAVLDRALDEAFAAALPDEALKILDAALTAAPAIDTAAIWHHARAHVLVGLGRSDDAIAAADRAVALEPGVPDFATNLAAALLQRYRANKDRGDLDKARAALDAAVEVGVRTSEVRATLAIVLEQLGLPALALTVCDDNLRLFPDDAPTLYNRAAALMALGRKEEALATLTALAPRFPPAAEAIKRHATTTKSTPST